MLRITRERLRCVLTWPRFIWSEKDGSVQACWIQGLVITFIHSLHSWSKMFDTQVLPLKSCFCVVISQNWAALTSEEFVLHWKWLKQTQSGRWNTLLWCLSKQSEKTTNACLMFCEIKKRETQQMGAKFSKLAEMTACVFPGRCNRFRMTASPFRHVAFELMELVALFFFSLFHPWPNRARGYTKAKGSRANICRQ